MAKTVPTRTLRRLWLSEPKAGEPPPAPRPLAAASGLVRRGEHVYVVADDERHLAVFSAAGEDPGRLLPLLPGPELPAEPAARKARKPDLETLAELPASPGHPHGGLLALGSGSTPARRAGSLVTLDAAGAPAGEPVRVELAPLYVAIETELGGLNVEGAAVLGPTLRLLHRGNGADGRDAIVDVALASVLDALEHGAPVGADALRRVRPVDLGGLGGVRLSFTDAAPLGGDRLLFVAAAEDSPDPYEDGRCTGSAAGLLGPRGEVLALWPLQAPAKVEGVTLGGDGATWLVTDADEPASPAWLLAAELPLP